MVPVTALCCAAIGFLNGLISQVPHAFCRRYQARRLTRQEEIFSCDIPVCAGNLAGAASAIIILFYTVWAG